jgi:hypothetical protein
MWPTMWELGLKLAVVSIPYPILLQRFNMQLWNKSAEQTILYANFGRLAICCTWSSKIVSCRWWNPKRLHTTHVFTTAHGRHWHWSDKEPESSFTFEGDYKFAKLKCNFLGSSYYVAITGTSYRHGICMLNCCNLQIQREDLFCYHWSNLFHLCLVFPLCHVFHLRKMF